MQNSFIPTDSSVAVARSNPVPLCPSPSETLPFRSLEPLRKPSRISPQEARAQLKRRAGQGHRFPLVHGAKPITSEDVARIQDEA